MRRLAKEDALARLADEQRSAESRGDDCVMCAMVKAERTHIRESRHAVCVLDRYGARAHHMLVLSKVHVESLSTTSWEVHEDMSRMAWEAGCVLERTGLARKVYLAQLGVVIDRLTSFAHAHVHVVPLDEIDERARPAAAFSWTSGVIVYDDEEAEAIARSLTRSWDALYPNEHARRHASCPGCALADEELRRADNGARRP